MKNDGKNAKNGNDREHASHASHSSHASRASDSPNRLLPPRGDYQTLLSFQKAELVYDRTFRFAHKIDQQLRRLDQDFLKEGGLRERMTRARLQ